MQVKCKISRATLTNDDGLEIEGVIATCSRCKLRKKSFGTSSLSIKRCLVLLRENCPRNEKNFYVETSTSEDDDDDDEDNDEDDADDD